MWTADGSLGVVFNGEIYNHLELRKALVERGHQFETDHSDTEALLHGYKEWRERLPEKLDGMWAFGIYDRNRRELFLSRDRFGKKPLFYTLQKGTFAFASELNALIKHTNVSSNVSKQSLKKYFAYGYIPAPASLCENIHKLPGGHNLHLNVATLDFSIAEETAEAIRRHAPSIAQASTERVRDELSRLLGREVDLVSVRALEENPNPTYHREIVGSARQIYAA